MANQYVLVMVDCFSRWTEACPLPNKTALAVADAFFQLIVCRFGMPAVIHSDQGREFENNLMQELCLLCGDHKTWDITHECWPCLRGEHQDDWDDLLPAVMMAYRSSVHESTRFSPYRLMFGEECTLPMDVGLSRRTRVVPDPMNNMYALEVAYDQVRRHAGQAVRRQKRLNDKRAVKRMFAVGDWTYPPAKKCKSPWLEPYLVVSLAGWAVGVQLHPNSPILMIHSVSRSKNNSAPEGFGILDLY